MAGQSFSQLKIEEIAATSVLIGDVKNAVALHDGVETTCTQIKKVLLRNRTVCSPFPTQLLLKLLGDFELDIEFKTMVTIKYFGGDCTANDVSVYTDSDDVINSCVTSAQSGNVHWPVRVCKLKQETLEEEGQPTACTFECAKSSATYISFAVTNAEICDVDYYKDTLA